MADITEILLSSIATTGTTTSVAFAGIELPYSIQTAFATATVYCSLTKTINIKIRIQIISNFLSKVNCNLPTRLKKSFNPSASIVASLTVID